MRKSIATIVLTLLLTITLAAQNDFKEAQRLVSDGDYAAAVVYIRKAVRANQDDAKTLALASQIYLELDLADSAVMYGRRAFDEDNSNSDYLRVYSRALIDAGKASEAVPMLRARMKKKDEVGTSLLLTDALLAADSVSQAEIVATAAKAKHAKNAEAWLALGNLYFDYKPQPVLELAIQNFEEATKLDNNLIQAHFNLAQSYWKMANRESDKDLGNELFKRSLQAWNTVTDLDPKNARAWFEQGKIFYLAKRYTDAKFALGKYRELRPVGTGNPLASWYLGNAYYELRQCDSAQQHLKDAAAQIDSVRNKASLIMARCLFFAKDFPGSVVRFTEAKNANLLEPTDFWYYGAALVVAGDTAQAIATMDQASRLDPKNCGLMFKYAVLLNSKGQNAASSRIYNQRLEHCKDSLEARIYALIGNNFYADSLVDSASFYYAKAVTTEPTNLYFLSRQAEIYNVRGDVANANAMFTKIYEMGKDRVGEDRIQAERASVRLAAICLQDKNYACVIENAKRATALNPKSLSAWIYLGVGNQGAGNKEEACRGYREALKLDPSSKVARDNMKSLDCP
ncbi:MAG: hypothetical protein SGJ05_11470 [bacterium]|nr:hypothetical protein [bacterium]